MKPYTIIAALVLLTACKKSTVSDNNTPTTIINTMQVQITASRPYAWGINEFDSGTNTATVIQSGSNVLSTNYSFAPVVGQIIQVSAQSATVSGIKIIVTYEGNTYDSVSSPSSYFTSYSSNTSGSEVVFTFTVTK